MRGQLVRGLLSTRAVKSISIQEVSTCDGSTYSVQTQDVRYVRSKN